MRTPPRSHAMKTTHSLAAIMKLNPIPLTALLLGLSLAAAMAQTNSPDARESDPRLKPDDVKWGFHAASDVDSKLPRVLLIGDSIVAGYGGPVIANLKGRVTVDVWSTGMNENSRELHEYLKKALAHGPYAVVHFNIGLHGWPKGRIPEGQYEPLMRKYVAVVQVNAPQARLIWTSTTPVTLKGSPDKVDPDINPIIVERNAIAARIMEDNHIPIDDLYGLMADKIAFGKGDKKDDQFHWAPPGVKLQADAVAAIILKNLPARTAALPAAGAVSPLELKSPDGKVALRFQLKTIGSQKGCPVYNVTYAGTPVLADSRLGLQLRDAGVTRGLEIIGQQTSTNDTTWQPVAGERDRIRDHYNQLVVELRIKGNGWNAKRLTVTFRAYDEGVAFNYTLPRETNGMYFDIINEATQFAFAGDFQAWAVYSAQADYTKSLTTISKILPGAERPLTVRVSDHLYASITEARTADYARMRLRCVDGAKNTLEPFLDAERAVYGEVIGKTPLTTPWRVVMLADSPGKLLEQNYLVLNLNDPCALADTSWIKPGKVIRDGSLTTAGGKASIDFSVQHHLQYVEFDAGWYGPQYDPRSDAREVEPSRRSSLNLQEVIEYGNAKGIGVILYVNHVAMEQQLDEILPLYERWGVKGVKYGFVNVGSQFWTALTHEAIRKAAAHHLMVDIHDEFRNCGYERTYPNLMTVEGIGGDETRPTPVHNATLPFTRFLTGPADHTFCWNVKNFPNRKGHQLAISTIFYSPWQFLYWYDSPKNIPEEPALDYWDRLPATWDDTRVLQGDIGRRVVVARRKGGEWFVGAIAPVDGKFPIALDFLPPRKKFTAKIFSDRPDKPGVQIEEQTVDNQSVLNADIPPNGGLAVRLAPQKAGEQ